MQLSIQAIKEAVAREYGQASTEVHNFINWLEQKDAQIASAKATLEASGYVVTPKPAVLTPVPPAPVPVAAAPAAPTVAAPPANI